jgi:hypothetical protein
VALLDPEADLESRFTGAMIVAQFFRGFRELLEGLQKK